MDPIIRDQPKLSKLKMIKQETTHVFTNCFLLHKDRRDYLIGEMNQLVGLVHARKNFPIFFVRHLFFNTKNIIRML